MFLPSVARFFASPAFLSFFLLCAACHDFLRLFVQYIIEIIESISLRKADQQNKEKSIMPDL